MTTPPLTEAIERAEAKLRKAFMLVEIDPRDLEALIAAARAGIPAPSSTRPKMGRKLIVFEIECGRFHGRIRATTLGAAWRRLTKNYKTGFGRLARFKSPDFSGWQYTTPKNMDHTP
jgi:hypothetical protein